MVFTRKDGDFDGFSMAMLVYQRVTYPTLEKPENLQKRLGRGYVPGEYSPEEEHNSSNMMGLEAQAFPFEMVPDFR